MRLVMFDMDGTLIDTQALIVEHMTRTFEGEGLPPPSDEQSRRVIGLSLPVAMAHLAPDADPSTIERLTAQYRLHYRAALVSDGTREALFPGAREALDRLAGRPDLILGIATGKGLSGVHRLLALHGLAERFVTLQTPDHNPSKPHPGMLHRAAAETGVLPQDTVMIGDTTFDIDMGRAAGTHALGVAWGSHAPDELRASGAFRVIERFDELDAALAQIWN